MPSTKSQRAKRKARIKDAFMDDLYKEARCTLCNRQKVRIQYHHLNACDKKDNVGRLISKRYAPKTIIKELEKCVPLCKSCHEHVHKYKIDLKKEWNMEG